jgi:hypothetical protein
VSLCPSSSLLEGVTNAIDRQHAGMRTGYSECESRSRFDRILARTRPGCGPLWYGVYGANAAYPSPRRPGFWPLPPGTDCTQGARPSRRRTRSAAARQRSTPPAICSPAPASPTAMSPSTGASTRLSRPMPRPMAGSPRLTLTAGPTAASPRDREARSRGPQRRHPCPRLPRRQVRHLLVSTTGATGPAERRKSL